VGHVALFVALAVVPVLALNSFATADTGSESRPGVTDAQRECLADQGVTLPTRGDGGDDRARALLTREQRREMREAAAACGLRGPKPRVALRQLTDDERQCLADQGITRPARRAGGGADARAAFQQAAEACGLPMRGAHGDRGTI
jgi:hypothetical protein